MHTKEVVSDVCLHTPRPFNERLVCLRAKVFRLAFSQGGFCWRCHLPGTWQYFSGVHGVQDPTTLPEVSSYQTNSASFALSNTSFRIHAGMSCQPSVPFQPSNTWTPSGAGSSMQKGVFFWNGAHFPKFGHFGSKILAHGFPKYEIKILGVPKFWTIGSRNTK